MIHGTSLPRRRELSILGTLAIVALLHLTASTAASASAPEIPSAPVTVLNDLANPVPISLQSGASIEVDGDVSVGGTVEVEPGTDPLLVDQAGQHIEFVNTGQQVCDSEDGTIPYCNGNIVVASYTVPQDRTLIIDAVALRSVCEWCVASNARPKQYAVLNPGHPSTDFLIGELQIINIFPNSTYVGRASASGLGLRVGGGKTVAAYCSAAGERIASTRRACSLRVWGRLLDE